ncbi:DUF885 domain-containing protein [Aggregatimonas sangjinii]|uniref:DUF885 domain-containing protein n=1 Tax=Aggregatimonas sangjinii TaxID=2583587 RepID=A0A5B7SJS9_9FLAO|nr:DUF885 domain-containing protein [Aggregatimonas sangjinii]QCW98724.1 DUF885 domain-containing protein [Aggregatimonas sangjinii]
MKNSLRTALLLTALCLVVSCKEDSSTPTPVSPEEMASASKELNDWFQQEWDTEVALSPMTQTYLGDKTDYDKWDDMSKTAEAEELERTKTRLAFLKDSVHPNALDEATKLSYKLAVQQMEDDIADYKYRLYNYPVNQMFGIHSQVPSFLINMHQITDKSDAEAYISRLNGVNEMFDQVIEGLKERETAGIVPPKFVFPRALESSRNILMGLPFEPGKKQSTLLEDFAAKVEKLDIPEEEKNTLKQEAEKALLVSVKPAYDKLIAFLEDQATRATEDDGAWKFPNGGDYFDNALARTTTTSMTADEIHELGLSEVKRIHAEMNAIKENVGFKGSLQDFFKFMKEDKQFYYPDTKEGREAYMKRATMLIDTMKGRLDELFLRKPKADMIVKAVEPFREKSAGKAFYQAPALDGSRPGTYYANMYDIMAMPKYQMEALAYHEGIPGHHMERAMSQELEDVPMFRKMGGYTAYTEGWGLYTEYIPKEMGMYSDPYSDFGRLAMELWRACRLVVDTGIHAKKWTREEGIAYYTDNTPNAESDAIKMVERHIVMPAQATAYKVGMNKILALREKAKTELGDKFDIREFHDVILVNGAVPLNVLEDMVDEWIARTLSDRTEISDE